MEMSTEALALKSFEVLNIEEKALSDRCCIDFNISFDREFGMPKGFGMLVGCFSRGLFLIHAETLETPFVASRPFRVNAGTVSLYTLVPPRGSNEKYPTRYLCELKRGDKVLVVDHHGRVKEAEVARNKIERRPMTMVTAGYLEGEAKSSDGLTFTTFVQTAETTRFVDEKGEPVPLYTMEKGAKILAYTEKINPHPVGRHFGMAIKGERIIEQ